MRSESIGALFKSGEVGAVASWVWSKGAVGGRFPEATGPAQAIIVGGVSCPFTNHNFIGGVSCPFT